jgi:hypothetical protein
LAVVAAEVAKEMTQVLDVEVKLLPMVLVVTSRHQPTASALQVLVVEEVQ